MNHEDIRKALDAATPGPWYAEESYDMWQLFGGPNGVMQLIKAPKHGTPYAEYWPDERDAHLIANAPTWLRSLLEELDAQESWKAISEMAQRESQQLREELERVNGLNDELMREQMRYVTFNESLRSQLAEKDKVLEDVRHGLSHGADPDHIITNIDFILIQYAKEEETK